MSRRSFSLLLGFRLVSTFVLGLPVRVQTGISGDRIVVPAQRLVRERKPLWNVSCGHRIRPFLIPRPKLPSSSDDDDDGVFVAVDGEGGGAGVGVGVATA